MLEIFNVLTRLNSIINKHISLTFVFTIWQVRTFANVLAGAVISLAAVVSGEIMLLNLIYQKPAVEEACWAYRTFIYILWYSSISINTSVFLKAVLFVVDLI